MSELNEKADSQPSDESRPKTHSSKTKNVALKCPYCGSSRLHIDDGIIKWCASCGATAAGWAYADQEAAELSRLYVKQRNASIPGRKVHPDTPKCKAPVAKQDGTMSECRVSNWQHNGERLLYCRSCGANYRGPQPDNVADIIATLGPAAPQEMDTPNNPKAFTAEDLESKSVKRQPGVNPEEFRAYTD